MYADQTRPPGGTLEIAKKPSLEDTSDVNVTNTSAAMFGDQSNIIQRPLPVNRIQQKITKDRTYGLDQHRAPRPSPEKAKNLLEAIYSPQK